MVSGHGRRLHLDGTLVSSVVWRHRKSSSEVPYLQKLEPSSFGRQVRMNLAIDQEFLLSELETLASISDAEPPAVTRIVFTPTDLNARAWLTAHCKEAGRALPQSAIRSVLARSI